MLCLVTVNSIFDFVAERPNKPLNGPGGGIAQSTDGVAFDLIRKLLQHVDFSKVGVSHFHAFKHVNHPAGTLAARCALTAGLVLVELGQSEDGVNHIGLVIHYNHSCSSKIRAAVFQVVEVHDCLFALFLDKHGH